ncbi:hypothetical protein GIB67_038637 [Kingdonia uniflora]|uniref:KIB1-4 beta-propeller domain-containing protein n=1 Tax=Kingdonia uniflora TaxID=39325 RepID=A0A7J7NQ26_9MAGN|nr:hypothetical protein GIB67_038637 [Kingdonia uniflora]
MPLVTMQILRVALVLLLSLHFLLLLVQVTTLPWQHPEEEEEEEEVIFVIRGMKATFEAGLERVLVRTDGLRLFKTFDAKSTNFSWGALTLAPYMLSFASYFLEFRFKISRTLHCERARLLFDEEVPIAKRLRLLSIVGDGDEEGEIKVVEKDVPAEHIGGKYWSELGEDLLGFITKRLASVADLYRRTGTHKVIPADTSRFFLLSSNKFCDLYLPEANGRRCWGSSFGWLITFGLDLEIHLLNPLSRVQIRLPPQPSFKNKNIYFSNNPTPQDLLKHFLMKPVMSSNPSSSNTNDRCTVVAIHGEYRKLAFASPGDKAWTSVVSPRLMFGDLIYFKGKFYAISYWGVLVICNIESRCPMAIDFTPVQEELSSIDKALGRYYLVEMSGELYLVIQSYEIPTASYQVYKLDFCARRWVETSLLDMYGKYGVVDQWSRILFDEMLERNGVSWNAMIALMLRGD